MIVEPPPMLCRFEKLPIFTTACIYRTWKTLHFRMPLLIASTKLLNLLIPVSSSLAKKKAKQRADFLRRIADNLEKYRNSVIETAEQETSLGLVRLEGECSRTIDQIRFLRLLPKRRNGKK